MPFNDGIDFTRTAANLKSARESFHVLLAESLRQSSTFELYDRIFKSIGLDAELIPIELADTDREGEASLIELVSLFRSNGQFLSILVSAPFKQRMTALVDQLKPQSKKCGAINMIYKKGEIVVGDNCDGEAFLMGIKTYGTIDFEKKHVLFFGCGGVTSAIAVALVQSLSAIGLVDLDEKRSAELRGRLRALNKNLAVEEFGAQGDRDFSKYQIIYNGTGLGKLVANEDKLQQSPLLEGDQLGEHAIAIDANYRPARSQFLQECEKRGLSVYNGLRHMLSSTAIHLTKTTGRKITYDQVARQFEKSSDASLPAEDGAWDQARTSSRSSITSRAARNPS
jgi:shikimate dehydrogenase